jgi:hypothetical protein
MRAQDSVDALREIRRLRPAVYKLMEATLWAEPVWYLYDSWNTLEEAGCFSQDLEWAFYRAIDDMDTATGTSSPGKLLAFHPLNYCDLNQESQFPTSSRRCGAERHTLRPPPARATRRPLRRHKRCPVVRPGPRPRCIPARAAHPRRRRSL